VGAASGVNSALVGTPIRSVYVRAPRPSPAIHNKPVQVLMALHGMGGNGEAFSKDLVEHADRYGWLLVAPTVDYGDWTKPDLIAREDPLLIRALANYLDQLPQIAEMPVRRQVLVLGHSRGAQLAHRFAEFRPDRVLAVAALSAGTYTLPLTSGPQGALSFPYGVKDLSTYGENAFDSARFGRIQFWVGVGGLDTNPAHLPRQWDTYEGTTRVQRAQTFESAMRQLGASSVLKVFGDVGHEFTSEMRTAACTFLSRAMIPRAAHGSPLAAEPLAR
jgi:pimeloyl-ACP methyl ester carboxylesterase